MEDREMPDMKSLPRANKKVAVVEIREPELAVSALGVAIDAINRTYPGDQLSAGDNMAVALARQMVTRIRDQIKEQL